MDHDVSTRIDAEFVGAFAVCRVGIGDVQRKVGSAVRVPADDGVEAFGSFVVALLLLRIAGSSAQPHVVDLERLAVSIERHRVGGFDDEDAVCRGRCDCRFGMEVEREKRSDKSK